MNAPEPIAASFHPHPPNAPNFAPSDRTYARMSECVALCSPEIRDCLDLACTGAGLAYDQALLLATSAPLEALITVADALRRESVGNAITYVVNRNINFTNVCFVGCSFCGFGKGPGAPDAYFHSLDAIVGKAREAADRGATEVCIQGGLPRDLDGFFYRDILRAIKRAFPAMHVHAFSPMEISYGLEKTGMDLRDYLRMMKDEGLGSIPGTAAEILDDRIRRQLSPNKLPVARWIEIITAAHELGIPTTSTMMYGHVEEPADWVRHILLLRGIQKRTGGFTEFVPLGFIHQNTRLYRRDGARAGAERDEHLRVHALARILLHGAIPNIQVSWVKLGFEISLACLDAGANDFGGTLMEESISKAAGATFGEYVSPEEFRKIIRSTGRIPAERSTTYKIRCLYTAAEDGPQSPVAQAPPSPARSSLGPGAKLLPVAQPAPHSPHREGAY